MTEIIENEIVLEKGRKEHTFYHMWLSYSTIRIFIHFKFIIFFYSTCKMITERKTHWAWKIERQITFDSIHCVWHGRNDWKTLSCTLLNSERWCSTSFDCFLSAPVHRHIAQKTWWKSQGVDAQMLFCKINWKMLLQASSGK